ALVVVVPPHQRLEPCRFGRVEGGEIRVARDRRVGDERGQDEQDDRARHASPGRFAAHPMSPRVILIGTLWNRRGFMPAPESLLSAPQQMTPARTKTAQELLASYLEAGADALLGEEPVDRFAGEQAAASVPAPAAEAPPARPPIVPRPRVGSERPAAPP